MDGTDTPRQIIRDCINFRVTEDEAVERMEQLIQAVKNELTGVMGETERKGFIKKIKGYYRDYGYPIKGSAMEISEYLEQALKECGYEELGKIKNTKENKMRIEDALFNLRPKLLG